MFSLEIETLARLLIDTGKNIGVVISLAPQHYAIKNLQMLLALLKRFYPAIKNDFEIREV